MLSVFGAAVVFRPLSLSLVSETKANTAILSGFALAVLEASC